MGALRREDAVRSTDTSAAWPASQGAPLFNRRLQGNAERRGLLPDSFTLRAQLRNDPAINPRTLQANAIQLFNRPALYDFHAFTTTGVLVHAPGAIRDAVEEADQIRSTVEGWPDHAYQILIVGLKPTPRVHINHQDVPLGPPHTFDPQAGRLILEVEGKPEIEITP